MDYLKLIQISIWRTICQSIVDITPSLNLTQPFQLVKYFPFIHANIRSSEANLKEFTYYLNNLNIEFTFIILSETWAKEHNTDMHIIPGYKQISCLRKNAKGGEVSIYVHNDISYKLRCDIQFDRKHHETAFVEINKRIFNSKRNIILGTIYRSPWMYE